LFTNFGGKELKMGKERRGEGEEGGREGKHWAEGSDWRCE
jgi:hypothetical protein